MFHLVSWSYFEISKNMAAYRADGSAYHLYDLRIYCHNGFFYKSAYKIARVFAHLEMLLFITSPTKFMNIWRTLPKRLTNWLNSMKTLDQLNNDTPLLHPLPGPFNSINSTLFHHFQDLNHYNQFKF